MSRVKRESLETDLYRTYQAFSFACFGFGVGCTIYWYQVTNPTYLDHPICSIWGTGNFMISINQYVWNIYHKHYRYDAFQVMTNFMTFNAYMLRKWFATYNRNVILPYGVYYFVWLLISSNQNILNIYHKHYRYDAFQVTDNFMILKDNMLCKWFTTYITNVIFSSGVYYFVWF